MVVLAGSSVKEVSTGDRVRVDIPDVSDPDYELYHGRHGTVAAVLSDDLGEVSGSSSDSIIYRVEFDSGEEVDFRGVICDRR